ncbi:TetR/AcrR family transcriptional regulator [Pengzhenrongella frigida]|uniref:TetR/AcrR family transcriptional regulator n=1 Tax=Pengzhenrongella frigida TaxID=1259133 RepID=A0A4Q5N552_9MICO|nr:TetR/AcrR family transcriptional regulator [Cellulomonas sp. HLT2-17]RYV51191.1 TetR/AcrR family transcriptional regulator [Cellulomonas sp. HLT2-17]
MSADAALPDRLITAALELLADQPAEELSIRQVAQRVGVSHQAPYVHFGDRRRFLAAVAGAGLEVAAADAQSRVTSAGPDPAVRLRALVRAYLSFVDERPYVHDLAYGPLVAMRDHPRLQAAALAYWNLLRDTVAANQPVGVPAAEVLRRAATAWGTVYGIARLDAAHKIPRTVPADRSQLLDDAIKTLLEGWRAPSAPGERPSR